MPTVLEHRGTGIFEPKGAQVLWGRISQRGALVLTEEDLKKEMNNSKEHLNQVSYYADVAIFPVLPSISSCAL